MSHLYKAIPLKKKDFISYKGYEVREGLWGYEAVKRKNGAPVSLIYTYGGKLGMFRRIDEILKSKNN